MGIRIRHLGGAGRGKVQTFDRGPVRLGRSPGSDVVFDPVQDRASSGEHAEIVLKNGLWIYRDLESSGGSWMEQARINEQLIKGGEVIEFGRGGPRLCFEIEEQTSDKDQGATTPVEEPPPLSSAVSDPLAHVGSKTVGMMIKSALDHTRDHSGRVPTMTFVRAVAGEAVRHSSRKFKIAFVIVTIALVTVVVFLVIELRRTQQAVQQLAASRAGPAEIGERIALGNREAIYLLLYRTGLGFEQGFCTGFAVTENTLLTNAHCVAQIEGLAAEGSTFFAAPNEGRGVRYQIVSWRAHSRYVKDSPRPTADIGLLRIYGQLPTVVPLAHRRDLETITSGAQIFVFGFPGDLSDVHSPVATITDGVVGRLTGLDGRAAALEHQHLLQHSAFTTKGTSGSPVFNKFGRVVAVNSGYYQGKTRVQIERPGSGKAEPADVSRDLAGYAFGIRVDLARELMEQ